MLQTGLTVFAAVFILIGIIVIAMMWRGKEWFVYWIKGSVGMLMLTGCILAAFTLVDLWSYRQLQSEEPLATLSIYQLGDQSYDITLADATGGERRFKLTGDQWQLDARLITWSGPFAAAGVKPLYRLDRLSGRYLSLEQERTSERTLYELSGSRWLDLWQALYESGLWLDAQFGSAVYMPMSNGAVFSIHLAPKGLIARPVNDVAKAALQVDW
ncbi:hypothetical protein [Bacterioplanoides sp.]|uniref:hypothetical protein n=1 Tax=Bacterioplanoides sp. TaxID=2066072 RepID=UPI003AFF9CCC